MRESGHTHTHIHTHTYTKGEYHVKIKAVGDATADQEYQSLPANHQKLGKRQGTDSSSQASEGANHEENLSSDF